MSFYEDTLKTASSLNDINGDVKHNFEGQYVHEHLIDLGKVSQKLDTFESKEEKLKKEIEELKHKMEITLTITSTLLIVIFSYLSDKFGLFDSTKEAILSLTIIFVACIFGPKPLIEYLSKNI